MTLQSNAGNASGSDSDMRLVYVSTHAEGVTRVLCFSDTKDQYTRDAYAEDAAGLTRRLAKLDEQLQVCHRNLVYYLRTCVNAAPCCCAIQSALCCLLLLESTR